MTKYKIIGNMTGNSMDAIDLVLTEFENDKMRDICFFTKPYQKDMQEKMEYLRSLVRQKTRSQIMSVPDFQSIHDEYVRQIADCINEMCQANQIDKSELSGVGFHGKTLDHNPPSIDPQRPYTLQIGSGQMLADLTGIPVVYDFRSDFIMNGFDGAPLVPPHNAHIAANEGDGCYYNGGNTSNFAWISGGRAVSGSDAGPFNEYTDAFIRNHTPDCYDKDGKYGSKGKLDKDLLQKLFNIGKKFYETRLPKSGDPQYYHKDQVFELIKNINFNDSVHTLEYFAAYIAVQALTLTDLKAPLPPRFILFGGGWKNPVVRQSFEDLVSGKGFVLPEHRRQFIDFLIKFNQRPVIKYSAFGEMMEARLFADLARYKLEGKCWEIPEVIQTKKKILCGRTALPGQNRDKYTDYINRACFGWQNEI